MNHAGPYAKGGGGAPTGRTTLCSYTKRGWQLRFDVHEVSCIRSLSPKRRAALFGRIGTCLRSGPRVSGQSGLDPSPETLGIGRLDPRSARPTAGRI